MSINPETLKLPTEHSIREIVFIYLSRLGTYLIVAIVSFLILGGILLNHNLLLILLAATVILFSILVFWLYGSPIGRISILLLFTVLRIPLPRKRKHLSTSKPTTLTDLTDEKRS